MIKVILLAFFTKKKKGSKSMVFAFRIWYNCKIVNKRSGVEFIVAKWFNVKGPCISSRHYMVDITDRLETMKRLVDREEYFVINRGRQYGKTTTLSHLRIFLYKISKKTTSLIRSG